MPDDDPLLALLQEDAIPLSPAGAAAVPPPTGDSRNVGVLEELGESPDSGTNPKVYSVVKLDQRDKSICFGMVEVGSAFCFCVNCKVQRQMDHKMYFETEEPIVVIQRSTLTFRGRMRTGLPLKSMFVSVVYLTFCDDFFAPTIGHSVSVSISVSMGTRM